MPGIILNIMYINDARRMQKIAGQSLPGVGCLWILLIVNVAWIFALCAIFGGLGIFGAGSI